MLTQERAAFFLKIDYLEHCMSAESVLPTLSGSGCVQVVMISGLITDLYLSPFLLMSELFVLTVFFQFF